MTASDDLAARLTLLTLPKMGPARARWLLAGHRADEVIAELLANRLPVDLGRAPTGVTADLVKKWTLHLRRPDRRDVVEECERLGIVAIGPADSRWPFHEDPDPPVALFAFGDLDLLDRRPAVAIVGTRRCSSIGREVAHRFGREIAAAGVAVVSGLATGIDGAAHRGAMTTRAGGGDLGMDGGGPEGVGAVVGVVGSGLDMVYPKANRDLWWKVAESGLLISEAGPGARPQRWRFPARNRLIAGIVDAVVVVESHAEGGSLSTVDEAAERGVPVLVVPGAVTNPASSGTNRLLADGCPPALSGTDVLEYLGVSVSSEPSSVISPELGLEPLAQRILDEVSAGSVHLDHLAASQRAPIPEILVAVHALVGASLVTIDGSTVSRC